MKDVWQLGLWNFELANTDLDSKHFNLVAFVKFPGKVIRPSTGVIIDFVGDMFWRKNIRCFSKPKELLRCTSLPRSKGCSFSSVSVR
jgi:hypothetical protein